MKKSDKDLIAIVPVMMDGKEWTKEIREGNVVVRPVSMRTYMEKFLARRGLTAEDVRRVPCEKGPLLILPEGIYMAVPMGEKGFGYLRLSDVRAFQMTPTDRGFLMAGGEFCKARGKAEALIGRYERALAEERARERARRAQ